MGRYGQALWWWLMEWCRDKRLWLHQAALLAEDGTSPIQNAALNRRLDLFGQLPCACIDRYRPEDIRIQRRQALGRSRVWRYRHWLGVSCKRRSGRSLCRASSRSPYGARRSCWRSCSSGLCSAESSLDRCLPCWTAALSEAADPSNGSVSWFLEPHGLWLCRVLGPGCRPSSQHVQI